MTLKTCLAAGAAILLSGMSQAFAAPVTVTITNNSDTNGLYLTPLFVAFHNGDYDAFNVGETAPDGTSRLAEIGAADGATSEALAADPNALTGVLANPAGFAGAPVIDPGESATLTFDVDPTSQRFFSFLSMVIPSNDTFIGAGSAVELFDAAGVFLGNQTLNITGFDIYDAGSEINSLVDSAAFAAIVDGIANPNPNGVSGNAENGVVTQSNGISPLNDQIIQLVTGEILDLNAIDFVSDRAGFSLATIEIDAAPVPVPAALPLMGVALGAGALLRRRKLKAAA